MNRMKNKKVIEGDQANEWRKSGSFVNKPSRGWLHPDNSVMGPGVVYAVRYLGCIEVRQSMRTLQFDMRTQATKEAIWRILMATRRSHQLVSRRKKTPKEVSRILGERPNLQFSLSLINLTISTASLTLVVTDSGQFIANHQMQSISFASGGDPDTLDFVAYVAKDPINNRACHVLECCDGVAQDVINTIGQAFELRFKEYLKNPPKAVTPPDRTEPLFHDGKSRWGDDEPEYYNEIPGKLPPEAGIVDKRLEGQHNINNGAVSTQQIVGGRPEASGDAQPPPTPANRQIKQRSFEDHNYINTSLVHQSETGIQQQEPKVFNNPMSNLSQSGASRHPSNLIDLTTPPSSPQKSVGGGALAIAAALSIEDHRPARHESSSSMDAFDMKPFEKTLMLDKSSGIGTLQHEPWFHGKLSRHDAEIYLKEDGDFLVRESSTTPGKIVLSGLHDGHTKHLFLVDPNGVVRTKDRQFDSVCHLISFHRNNNLPIVSSGSMLMLQQPVIRKIER
ncbi:SHC-transforming protein 1-like [Styela clava]|uniref:SHC-transforming protein 1-like n=1 Tax=Styela clava TaxID=7725 RepID=UPI00193A7132|nr:SHC-transforming protein 1-like [Styela clava]